MIVKRKDGWHVYSESKKGGKRRHLGGPYQSELAARRRIMQVEYFKRHKK
jgi:hypothetical protein